MFLTVLPLAAAISATPACKPELHVGPATLEAGVGVLEVAVEVTDPAGENVADGTVLTLAVERPGGTETLSAVTADGLAVFYLSVGPRTGLLSVKARACASRSRRESVLILTGTPAGFPVRVEPGPASEQRAVVIGPVVDAYGNVVEDGTEIRLILLRGGQPISLRTDTLIGGQARVTLSSSQADAMPDRLDIVIRGRTQSLWLANLKGRRS